MEAQWQKRFSEVGIEQEDAQNYAAIFVKEDMPWDLTGLDNSVLAGAGIQKAGHCMKILSLVPRAQTAEENTPLIQQHHPDVPCKNHPDREAVVKCVQYDCRGNFCLACVSGTGHGNFWCHECHPSSSYLFLRRPSRFACINWEAHANQ